MRIKWIDTAKGIAMLCVILGHMDGIQIAGINLNFVYAFHLPIFFILSGFTLKKKELTSQYINDRFNRLMVPYFWTCFCVLIMNAANSILLWDNAGVQDITEKIASDLLRFFFASGTFTEFVNVDMGGAIGAIWFLPAMFFAIVLVQCILNATEKHYLRWIMAISIALIAYISTEFMWLPFSIQSGAFMTSFILLGYYIREYDVLNKLSVQHYVLFFLILLLAIFTNNTDIYYVVNYYPDIIFSMIISITSSLLVIRLAVLCQNCNILNFIGNNSIYFLTTHLISLEILKPHFLKVISKVDLSLNAINIIFFFCSVVFSSIITMLILFVQNKHKNGITTEHSLNQASNYSIEITKALLTISMLFGCYNISQNFRDIIYSVNMMAFVFLSGLLYNKKENNFKNIIYMVASIILMSMMLSVCLLSGLWKDDASMDLLYFLIMLYGVKLLYTIVEHFINKEYIKIFVGLAISYIGVLLGRNGIWLPFNLDCVMYALVFYMLGYYFAKYKLFNCFKNNLILYFVLSSLWVYMIYKGGTEVLIRLLEPYGVVILGAVSGIILLYLLSSYMSDKFPRSMIKILSLIGKNAVYILITNAVFGRWIGMLIERIFDPEYMYYVVLKYLIEVGCGIIIGILISSVKEKINLFGREHYERE